MCRQKWDDLLRLLPSICGFGSWAEGHRCHIDAIIDDWIWRNNQRIEVVKPSLVVVDTSTPSINSDLRFCKAVKAQSVNSCCCRRYLHKNTNTIEMASDSFDVCVISEYEQTVSELAEKTEAGEDWKKINGIAYLSPHNVGGNYNWSTDLAWWKYLDRLGFVRVLPSSFWRTRCEGHFYASINWLRTNSFIRGCPFKCTFVTYPRSVHIATDRQICCWWDGVDRKKYGFVKEIFFEDDTFPINPKRTLVCDEIISRGLKITWSCNARVDCKPGSQTDGWSWMPSGLCWFRVAFNW